jgi:hypothetical protein
VTAVYFEMPSCTVNHRLRSEFARKQENADHDSEHYLHGKVHISPGRTEARQGALLISQLKENEFSASYVEGPEVEPVSPRQSSYCRLREVSFRLMKLTPRNRTSLEVAELIKTFHVPSSNLGPLPYF